MVRFLPVLAGLLALTPLNAAAQSADAYAGKRLTVIVGVEAGGTIDTLARAFRRSCASTFPATRRILVQNMPGAGGTIATNSCLERAAPDGLTILYKSWDPLAQALGDQLLRARYEQVRVSRRHRRHPRQLRAHRHGAGRHQGAARHRQGRERDPRRAQQDRHSGLLPQLALEVLGVKHKHDRRLSRRQDVFLAMQRGEVQFHSTSISTFRSRNARLHQVGRRLGIAYLVPSTATETTSEPVHHRDAGVPRPLREMHGKMPSGPRLGRAQLADQPDRRDDLRRLRAARHAGGRGRRVAQGFEGASNDPEFVKESVEPTAFPSPM